MGHIESTDLIDFPYENQQNWRIADLNRKKANMNNKSQYIKSIPSKYKDIKYSHALMLNKIIGNKMMPFYKNFERRCQSVNRSDVYKESDDLNDRRAYQSYSSSSSILKQMPKNIEE